MEKWQVLRTSHFALLMARAIKVNGFNELPIRAVLLPKFEASIFLGNSMVRAPARHEFSEGRCRFHLEGSHLLSIGTICYHLFQSVRAM